MAKYWIEYDENCCIHLVSLEKGARIPIQHGMILDITEIQPPKHELPLADVLRNVANP